jgi:hypothetical protein
VERDEAEAVTAGAETAVEEDSGAVVDSVEEGSVVEVVEAGEAVEEVDSEAVERD